MAFSRGPVIVRDGLVLYYDAANIKSFRGEPTTNLVSNMDTRSYTNHSGATSTREVVNVYPIEFKGTDQVIRFQSSGGTSALKFYFGISGLGEFDPATFRGRVYNNNPSSSLILLFNSFSISSITIPPLTYVDLSNRSGVVDSGSEQIQFRASTSNDVIDCYVSEFQIEKRSYSTFYVNGTRGTTVVTGGGLIDLSKNNSNGELLGPVFNSSNQGILSFDGTDDIISIPNSSPINISGNITINCWVRRNTSAGGVIIHKQLQYTLSLNANGTLTYADSSLWSYDSFGYHGNITANQFVNIAVTKSGSTVTIYANGSVVISKTFGGVISQTSNTLYIGTYNGDSAFFNGLISNVQIYNRSLTSDEILQNYNAMKGRFI